MYREGFALVWAVVVVFILLTGSVAFFYFVTTKDSSFVSNPPTIKNARSFERNSVVFPAPITEATSESVHAGIKIDGSSNLSAIIIYAHEPMSVFLVDKDGNRVGKDPKDGKIYAELRDSSYHLEAAIGNPENKSTPPPNLGVQELYVLKPQAGLYSIKMYNPGGEVKADIAVYDKEGNASGKELNQKVEPNQTIEFDLNYSPDVGSKILLNQKN